jgi:hypothetical protein
MSRLLGLERTHYVFYESDHVQKVAEIEEERWNWFVVINRTRECLFLGRAESYRGSPRESSCFLVEMELVSSGEEDQ